MGRLAFDISTPNSYKLLTSKSYRYLWPVSNDMSETKSILSAVEQLKELRLRLGMTTRDVTDLSQKIIDSEGNQEFHISNAWLTEIENSESIPSIYKLY